VERADEPRVRRTATHYAIRVDFVVVDRGFGACHIPISEGPRSRGKPMVKWSKRIVAHLESTIGVRGPGEMYQHTCEIHGTSWRGRKNVCINPDHVSIGNHSTNTQTMHDLRVAAGLPWTGISRPNRGPYRKRQ